MNEFSHLTDLITQINHFLWGIPAMTMLFGTGLYLTYQLRFIQFRRFIKGCKLAFGEQSNEQTGSISRFEALATSLSGAIGTGNIAGVAIAISLGGPGAIFWMWCSALIGMATKFTSCTLAVKYRELTNDGTILGGPMYTLKNALNMPILGGCFAVFALFACFGTGNAIQSNSIASGMQTILSGHEYNPLLIGVILSVSVGLVTLGGVQRIGKVASFVVPFMAILYFLCGLVILAMHYQEIPHLLWTIPNAALNPHAASGAAMGLALRYGLARGIFSNEAGLGSAPIAHAAACTDHPAKQGLVAMIDPFIDTLLVCSTTAMVILVTHPGASAGEGAALSAVAFEKGLQGIGIAHLGSWVVALGLIFFAYTTIIAWAYYGEQCIQYLLGHNPRVIQGFRIIYTLVVIPGAILPLKFIWQIADLSNILMAIPNIISVVLLCKVVKELSKDL